MSWAETCPSFGLSCLCGKKLSRVLTSLTESPLPSFNSLSSLTEADSHAPSGCFGAPHALSHLGVDGGRVVSSTGGGSGRLGALQIGRDEEAEDAVDAIDSDGASPEAPDRLSVPPVPAVDPTERVQLRRRPREVIPGLQPGPRTVRLAARAVTLPSLFSFAMAPFRTRFRSTGGERAPITGVSIYAPVSTVPSPARLEALCALSPKPVFRLVFATRKILASLLE